jgi:hypothetical protein
MTTGKGRRVNTYRAGWGCQVACEAQPCVLVSEGERAGSAVPVARTGLYELLCWHADDRHIPTGRIGTAIVRLPTGALGAFAVYELAAVFAEPFPTNWLRRVTKRDHRELSEATPVVVELVKRFDPGAFSGSSRCRPKFAA